MAVDKVLNELDMDEGTKSKKTKKVKKTKRVSKAKKPKLEVQEKEIRKSADSKGGNFFNLIIVVVIILGIIGIVFGYTKSKITNIDKDGTEVSKGLENQIGDLKNQLRSLTEIAEKLEKENATSKNIVLDLFNKEREIPRQLNVEDWNILEEMGIGYTVSFPKHWEKVKSILGPDNESGNVSQAAYFQPIGQPEFINAITIKEDYSDFSKLALSEKVEIFEELDALDIYKFDEGVMIYFINLDKNNEEVPTVIILTEDAIYRAIFNVSNKTSMNYFKYRQEFEEVIATFALMPEMLIADEEEVTEEQEPELAE